MMCSIWKDKGEADVRFLTENNPSKARVDQPLKNKREKPVNPEPSPWQNSFQK